MRITCQEAPPKREYLLIIFKIIRIFKEEKASNIISLLFLVLKILWIFNYCYFQTPQAGSHDTDADL